MCVKLDPPLPLVSQKGSHPRKKSILKVSTSTSTVGASAPNESSETVVQLKPFGHHLLSSDSGQRSDHDGGGLDEPKQNQPLPLKKQQNFHRQPPTTTTSEIVQGDQLVMGRVAKSRVRVWVSQKKFGFDTKRVKKIFVTKGLNKLALYCLH